MIFLFINGVSAFIFANLLLEIEELTSSNIMIWILSPFFIFSGVLMFYHQMKYQKIIMSIGMSIFLSDLVYSFFNNIGNGYFLVFKLPASFENCTNKIFKVMNKYTLFIILTLLLLTPIFTFLILRYLKQKGILAFIYASSVAFVEKRGFTHFFSRPNNVWFSLMIYLAHFSWVIFCHLNFPFVYYITIVSSVSIVLIIIAVEYLFMFNWYFCVNIAINSQNKYPVVKPRILPILMCFLLIFVSVEVQRQYLKKKKKLKNLSKKALY